MCEEKDARKREKEERRAKTGEKKRNRKSIRY